MTTTNVFIQIITVVVPGVITGLIILTFEYMTPWFARRRLRDRVLSLVDTPWIQKFQENIIIKQEPKDSFWKGLEPSQLIVSKLEKSGESHYKANVEVILEGESVFPHFEIVCSQNGDVISVRRTIVSISKVLDIFSFAFLALFWIAGTGVAFILLVLSDNFEKLYEQFGLNIFEHNPILIIIISAQLAILPAILFAYPIKTVSMAKGFYSSAAPFWISLSTWLQCTFILGIYPLSIQVYINRLIKWRSSFQAAYLSYKDLGNHDLIWASDLSLLVFAGLLTIVVTIMLVWWLFPSSTGITYLILISTNLLFYVSSETIFTITFVANFIGTRVLPIIGIILKWMLIVGGTIVGIIVLYFLVDMIRDR